MFKSAGLDFEALKARAKTEAFAPVALPGVTFSADYDLESSTVVTHNVIGKLVGTSRPNEAVLYGAHWDHLGIGAPDASGDTIYHGAVDNASGVSALIELGRLFAEAPRTPRSLYFIAFTSEEKNLLGAGYYAAHPVVPLGTTVALLNMDVMNLDGASRDISDRGPGNMPLETLFASEGAKFGRTYSPDPQPQEGAFFRADHFALAAAGVPAITILGRTGLRRRRTRGGEGSSHGLFHRALSPAVRPLAARLQLRRRRARSGGLLRPWPRSRGVARLAAGLGADLAVQARPRRERGDAEVGRRSRMPTPQTTPSPRTAAQRSEGDDPGPRGLGAVLAVALYIRAATPGSRVSAPLRYAPPRDDGDSV